MLAVCARPCLQKEFVGDAILVGIAECTVQLGARMPAGYCTLVWFIFPTNEYRSPCFVPVRALLRRAKADSEYFAKRWPAHPCNPNISGLAGSLFRMSGSE